MVEHVYKGISDWNRYTPGSSVAANFHHFHFTTAGTGVGKIVNDGSVSIATGIVMTIVGGDDLATFLVFAWLVLHRRHLLLPRLYPHFRRRRGHRRYAYFVFLLPSILFWTGDASKEAIMFFALSLVAYGAARVLRSRPGGFLLMVPGVLIGVFIRPNELVLLLGGFCHRHDHPGGVGGGAGPLRRFVGFSFAALMLVFSLYLTQHYLVHGGGSITGQL